MDETTGWVREDDPAQRAKAAHALKVLGMRAPLDVLVAALQDPAARVRSAAIWSLAVLKERAPVDLLLARFEAHSEERQAIVNVLRRLQTPAARGVFVAALSDSRNYVAQPAVWGLRDLGGPVPPEPLLALLLDTADTTDLALSAAELLGAQGERAPVDHLLTLLQAPHPRLRARAARALGSLREQAPQEALQVALSDPEGTVRKEAVRALGKLGDRAPVEALVEVLQTDQDARVRAEAAAALSQLGQHMPVEVLLQALTDPEQRVAAEAARALGTLGDHLPVERMLTVLDAGQTRARAEVVQALGKAGANVPIARLVECLQDAREQRWVHWEASQALGTLGERAPLEPLIAALDTPLVRSYAATALGKVGPRVPAEPLIAVLERYPDDFWATTAAARALGALGKIDDRLLIGPLLEALHEPDPDIRGAAVEALGALGLRVPVSELVQTLNDTELEGFLPTVRVLQRLPVADLQDLAQEASALLLRQDLGHAPRWLAPDTLIEALEKTRVVTSSQLEQLLLLLAWPYWEVRARAVRALGRVARPIPDALLRRLHDLCQDPESRVVRQAALEALAKMGSGATGSKDE